MTIYKFIGPDLNDITRYTIDDPNNPGVDIQPQSLPGAGDIVSASGGIVMFGTVAADAFLTSSSKITAGSITATTVKGVQAAGGSIQATTVNNGASANNNGVVTATDIFGGAFADTTGTIIGSTINGGATASGTGVVHSSGHIHGGASAVSGGAIDATIIDNDLGGGQFGGLVQTTGSGSKITATEIINAKTGDPLLDQASLISVGAGGTVVAASVRS